MSSNSLSNFEEEFNRLKLIVIFFVITEICFVIYGYYLISKGDTVFPMFIVQAFSALTSILMVAVIAYQAKIMGMQTQIMGEQFHVSEKQRELSVAQTSIMDKQTKLLELEKKPMLAFVKRTSKNVISLETFVISQYPLVIENFEFEPSGNAAKFTQITRVTVRYPKEYNHNESLDGINNLIGYPLLPKSSILIIIANPDSMPPPSGIVKLRASNLYYSNVVLEYEYDLDSGKLKIKEDL